MKEKRRELEMKVEDAEEKTIREEEGRRRKGNKKKRYGVS